MEVLSKKLLIQQALESQKAWLVKIELKKNVNYSYERYNHFIVPELIKIYPESVLDDMEIRMLYNEEFIIKKFEKYQEANAFWKNIPAMEDTMKNEIIQDLFFIYCSLIDKDGMEIKNNKKT